MMTEVPPRPPSHRPVRRMVLWTVVGLLAALGGWIVYQILTWPDVARLATENPPTTAFIQRFRERQRAEGEPDRVWWQWVPASGISPNLKRAVVVAEDIEFFSHHGFSTAELKAALREAVEERRAPRGASTITQQLAKNLWLSPSRNPLRKLREAILTKQLERRLTKDRILELYLNLVEFGPGVYGAEAAAQRYFGRPAAALSVHQAAQLAASLPRPSVWHPGISSRPYDQYVAEIEGRMERAAFVWRRVGGAPPLPFDLDSLPKINLDSLSLLDSVSESDSSPVAGGAGVSTGEGLPPIQPDGRDSL